MTTMQKCPICGKENLRTSASECVGTVEDYYNCECGYFIYMAYCPRVTGVLLPENTTKEEYVAKYGHILKEQNIRLFLPGEIELP